MATQRYGGKGETTDYTHSRERAARRHAYKATTCCCIQKALVALGLTGFDNTEREEDRD